MYTDENKLDQIKNISVIDVATRLNIRIKGRKAYCFSGHDKKTPSLSFEPKRNIWKCFGCGKGGDGIKLVMEVCSCNFKAALDWFSAEFGCSSSGASKLDKKRIPCVTSKRVTKNIQTIPRNHKTQPEFTADIELYTWFIHKCGSVKAKQGQLYLNNHGISQELADGFRVRELRDPQRAIQKLIADWGVERVFRSGIAWRNNKDKSIRLIWSSYALLFPFIENDNIIYLQGRMFLGKRKYVNPQGIQKPLFNRDRLHALSNGATVHICEGIPDAIALEGTDFPAVAVLGATSFRSEWVDDFVRFNVVLIPDGDVGGKTFVHNVSECFRKRGKSVRVIQAPKGLDVADVVAQIISRGERGGIS